MKNRPGTFYAAKQHEAAGRENNLANKIKYKSARPLSDTSRIKRTN
jgi:hypothetical protein